MTELTATLEPAALAVSAKMMGLDETSTARHILYFQKRGQGGPVAYLADFAYKTALMALGSQQPEFAGHVLGVPFVSQKGPGADLASGDCGPACAAMCIRYVKMNAPTVDDLVREMGVEKRYTHAGDLIAILKKHRIGAKNYGEYDRENGPLTDAVIEQALAVNRPVIALVNYGELRRAAAFRGLHWVVVYGHADNIYYLHDPLDEFGREMLVDRGHFMNALATTKRLKAQAYHGIVVMP